MKKKKSILYCLLPDSNLASDQYGRIFAIVLRHTHTLSDYKSIFFFKCIIESKY